MNDHGLLDEEWFEIVSGLLSYKLKDKLRAVFLCQCGWSGSLTFSLLSSGPGLDSDDHTKAMGELKHHWVFECVEAKLMELAKADRLV